MEPLSARRQVPEADQGRADAQAREIVRRSDIDTCKLSIERIGAL